MVISPAVAINPSAALLGAAEDEEHTVHHHHHRPNIKNVPYLIITNISKRQNVRNLLQIAAAYGVPTVFVVGQKKFVFDLVPLNNDDDILLHANNNDTVKKYHDSDEEIHEEVAVGDETVLRHRSKTTTCTATDVPPTLQRGIRNGKLTIVKFDKLEECVAYIKKLPCCFCVDGDRGDGDDGRGCSGNDRDDVEGRMATTKEEQSQSMVHNTTQATTTTTTTTSRSPNALPTRANTTIPIVGVEIDHSSINLEEEPFSSFFSSSFFSSSSCSCNSIAFMMGNEGSGMSTKQMSICDGFIRISQYGGGTASLNVSVAAALVLHRYHHWRRGEVAKNIVRCAV